jgi:CrcB protein
MESLQMHRLFWICLAGAAGTAARYFVGLWAARRLGPEFPYGTLIVNLVGCFLIAFVMNVAVAKSWPETTRLAVTVGFLGGFTTYSSFNYETTGLAGSGAVGLATVYLLLTLLGGFAAGLLGLLASRALLHQ